MKALKYHTLLVVYLAGLLFLGLSANVSAMQDSTKEMITPSLVFYCQKNADGGKTLKVKLEIMVNDLIIPVHSAKIKLASANDPEIGLGEVSTNTKGRGTLTIGPEVKLTPDAEGYYILAAEFEGNDTLNPASGEARFKDMNLVMEPVEQDSMRSLKIRCFNVNEKGEEIPLPDLAINIYVGRMFSDLKVAEGKTDSLGECNIDFPVGLVGDSIGNMAVMARLEGHESYGNVEARQILKWGIATQHKVPRGQRALWTQIAPTWMIITLIILLSGVWGHYIYAIVKIVGIKKEGKKAETKET